MLFAKKSNVFIALCVSFLSGSAVAQVQNQTAEQLPVSSKSVFQSAMQDPNVLFFLAESAYQKGQYETALAHFLEASKYNHAPAIQNTKFMISKKMVTAINYSAVIDFLLYHARPGTSPEPFVTALLASHYHGASCVFGECESQSEQVSAHVDYEKSYYFHSLAADAGDLKSSYTVGMMDLTGIGTAKNPVMALERFERLAEQGSVHAAYLCAKILQGMSGVLPDPARAAAFLQKSALQKHARSMLELASVLYRQGVQYADPLKTKEAIRLYSDLISGLFASESERVEARYELAIILQGDPQLKSSWTVVSLMSDVAASTSDSLYKARANVYLGDLHSDKKLSDALTYYNRAAEVIERLPVIEQQKNADVWQKMAAVYGKGDATLDRSELLYARHMTTYRSVMAKTPEPGSSDHGTIFGYHVFTYPGA